MYTPFGLTKIPGSWLALLCVSSMAMGQTLVFTILPVLARDTAMPEYQVGLILTGSSIAFTWASSRWGRYSDRRGRKPVMLVGLLGYSLGTLLFTSVFGLGLAGLLAGTGLFVWLVTARMFQALLMAATSPAAVAYLIDSTDESERIATMGRIGASQNLGTILGPVAASGLALIHLLLPLFAAAAITLMAAILVWFYLPSPPARENTKPPAKLRVWDRRYLGYLALGVSVFMCFSVVHMTIGFLLADKLAVGSEHVVAAIGMGMVLLAVSSLTVQGVVIQRIELQPVWLMRLGLPFMLVGFLILTQSQHLWQIYLAMLMLGSGMGFVAPGFTSAATLTVSAKEQGSIAGMISAVPAMGYIVGPIIGTSLYQISDSYPYWFSAGITLLAMGYSWLVLKPKRIESTGCKEHNG